jgi:uncharacterized membrane protein (DUF485 family)
VDEIDKLDLPVPRFTGSDRWPAAAGEGDGHQHVEAGRLRASAKRHVKLTSRELLESDEFRHLVARRWRVALVLTVALFVVYYGFILLVATQRGLLATRIGEVTTLGILLGMAVLVLAWGLTAAYVVWANGNYDPEVQRLRDRLRH